MTSTKKSLFTSAVALVLCFAMLVGTTFAWFTDEVTSSGNIIQTGKLDANMYWSEELLPIDSENLVADGWNNAAESKVFDYNNWEPGFSQFRYVLIENAGSLDFKWHLTIDADGKVTELAEVIDVYYITPGDNGVSKADLNENNYVGTLDEVLARKDSNDGILKSGERVLLAIAFHMQETAGNEYQNKALCEGGFSLNLIAAQASATGENDSFDDLYDENAAAAIFPGFQGGSGNISLNVDENGYTTTESTADFGDVFFFIPIGVKLADGYENVKAHGLPKDTSNSNVQLGDSEKMRPSDVHVDGVAADNTKAILVTLRHYLTTGLNTGALKIFHVEDGATVAMTHVQNPVNHNEFSYDPLTGDVTLALASFSEVAVVADTNNPWNGETETAYTGSGTEADPYLIANADQLAKFRTDVDNGNSFEGKFVKLNNNIYLSGKDFDPIGWGYVNSGWNRDGADGKVFQGTFDGNGKIIFDLHQSGWDLEQKTGTDYTYTNCGFGLFAAASGATFKNLTISGAYVRVECVEAGVLVGLSQNGCTYNNIQIHNSKIANYQRPAGGLIGEVSGDGTTKITNVTIGSDVVVGSLWGDFDAPCGGVIGAYWNDAGKNPKIEMTDVEVGARMDVYSDVTSAYQWYAYRRAGMLIGNTDYSEKNENGTNIASTKINGTDYLICSKVKVYYGDWANYHYAQFTNQDNSWCNNYPWVRVEAGENCSAYSNPRYGVPVVDGVKVSDMDATTLENTQTGYVERRFNQLYGGGQGVYGQFEHEGVEVINYRYSITYVNDSQVLAIKYVTESGEVKTANDVAANLVKEWASKNMKEEYGEVSFGGWMNAASIKLTEIPANNTKNVVLYPYFDTPYTASFVDQQGNILDWCFFNQDNIKYLSTTFSQAKDKLSDLGEDFELINWVIRDADGKIGELIVDDSIDWESFKEIKKDVTITPKYRYKGADLIEIIDKTTGEIDHYQVAGYTDGKGSILVEIPAYVNGKPVTIVNENAFSSYDDLHSIRLPDTIKTLNAFSFTNENNGTGRDTVTIYYEGTPEEWDAIEKIGSWDYFMGDGSRVFFLDENGKVINDGSVGYWELYKSGIIRPKYTWIYHDHAYSHTSKCTSHKVSGSVTNYTGNCTCNYCKEVSNSNNGQIRPDAGYWTPVANTEE